MKHTPTPWYFQGATNSIRSESNGGGVKGQRGPDGRKPFCIAKIPTRTMKDNPCSSEMKANAAHIVKCVNAHDGLVEVLGEVAEYMDKYEEHFCDLAAKEFGDQVTDMLIVEALRDEFIKANMYITKLIDKTLEGLKDD